MTDKTKELSDKEYVDKVIYMKNETLANTTAAIAKKTQELLVAGKIGPIDSDVAKNLREENIPACSELIRRMQDTRPICPDCKTIMAKTHTELSDGSGWFSGWGCDCKYEPKS